MSVVLLYGHDPAAATRAQAARASEADRLLQVILEAGDLVGRDGAGRMVIQLAVARADFERLMAFGADAVECDDGGDDEPYDCPPMSPCWFWDGGSKFCAPAPDDLVPPKRIRRTMRAARAVALALLLVAMHGDGARADQTAATTGLLPMSTMQQAQEQPARCCRMCRKGKACGDGCISAERQCRKESGCACSAPASDS
jgi:hypothetical protein